jgi:hypothetical protein
MAGLDAVQLALHQTDPALAAGAIAGAGSINGHIGSSGQLQQIVAGVAVNGERLGAFDLENNLAHHKISFYGDYISIPILKLYSESGILSTMGAD